VKHTVDRLLAGLVVLALMAVQFSCSKTGGGVKSASPAGKPVPVLTAVALQASVPLEISTFGEAQANSTVSVKAQVSGTLIATHFEKGQEVKAGQLLFEIDPQPFKVALEQLQASKAKDVAQLENSRKELARQEELLKKGISSTADYDNAVAAEAVCKATVLADDAGIDNAKLQLGYCTITSPMAGRAGDILVDPGNLVKASDASLVTIDQIKPIEVGFSITQSDLPAVRKHMAAGPLQVQAIAPGTGQEAEVGVLTFVDNTINANTRMIKLFATFPNDNERLWPGQYVDVVLTLTVEKDVIVIPSQAVQIDRDRQYVFVITASGGDKIAEIRPIKVGRKTDGLAVIESGLAAGDEVVTDGQVRLLPGAKVKVDKSLSTSLPASATQANRSSQPATSQDTQPATTQAGDKE
jgi:multidrug efflux system membrane fusion protein